MRILTAAIVLIFALTACQPAAQDTDDLPTLVVLPSATPTEEPTNIPTITTTPLPTDTRTPRPTTTPIPPDTAVPTQAPLTFTPDSAATSTAVIQNAPRIVTLTPGGNAPSTPQALADVIITQSQFQQALNTRLQGVDSIQTAVIRFVPEGIQVQLTALGGQAFTTGEVLIAFDLAEDFVQISIGEIRVNAVEPPPEYVEVIGGTLFPLVVETFDAILTERLGEEHNLQSLVFNGNQLEIMLLVPQ